MVSGLKAAEDTETGLTESGQVKGRALKESSLMFVDNMIVSSNKLGGKAQVHVIRHVPKESKCLGHFDSSPLVLYSM